MNRYVYIYIYMYYSQFYTFQHLYIFDTHRKLVVMPYVYFKIARLSQTFSPSLYAWAPHGTQRRRHNDAMRHIRYGGALRNLGDAQA